MIPLRLQTTHPRKGPVPASIKVIQKLDTNSKRLADT